MSSKAGLPPGTLVHVGKKKSEHSLLSQTSFDKEHYSAESLDTLDKVDFSNKSTSYWLNLDGLANEELVAEMCKLGGGDSLLAEDVLNPSHRPKFEEFESHLFVTLKMIGLNRSRTALVSEQVSFILGDNFLISFQEKQGDVFNNLRERLETKGSAVRANGVDFLLYRLIDTIVDYYFFVTEYFSEALLKLEEEVLNNPTSNSPAQLQQVRKKLLQFKKSVMPLREAIANMQRSESALITERTKRFLFDINEHVIQISDTLDSQRDLHASVMDLYYSAISNKTNQIMQVLTIISTIFIPLTFVAGIYGMNFKVMPELEWEYGYPMVWIVMGVLTIIMMIIFKRRKWF